VYVYVPSKGLVGLSAVGTLTQVVAVHKSSDIESDAKTTGVPGLYVTLIAPENSPMAPKAGTPVVERSGTSGV